MTCIAWERVSGFSGLGGSSDLVRVMLSIPAATRTGQDQRTRPPDRDEPGTGAPGQGLEPVRSPAQVREAVEPAEPVGRREIR